MSNWNPLISPKTQIPDIFVTFGNGVAQKMVLYHYNPIPRSTTMDHSRLCNYIGHLKGDEKDSRVAVSGCLLTEKNKNEKVYITLLSKHSLYQKSFSLDRRGNTNVIKTTNSRATHPDIHRRIQDRNIHFDDWNTYGEERYWLRKQKLFDAVTDEQMASVPYSINVNFRLGYDKGTKRWMMDSDQNIDNWLAEVMTHTQIHFTHSSLRHYVFLNVSHSKLWRMY